jgi:hypothetical protein
VWVGGSLSIISRTPTVVHFIQNEHFLLVQIEDDKRSSREFYVAYVGLYLLWYGWYRLIKICTFSFNGSKMVQIIMSDNTNHIYFQFSTN